MHLDPVLHAWLYGVIVICVKDYWLISLEVNHRLH